MADSGSKIVPTVVLKFSVPTVLHKIGLNLSPCQILPSPDQLIPAQHHRNHLVLVVLSLYNQVNKPRIASHEIIYKLQTCEFAVSRSITQPPLLRAVHIRVLCFTVGHVRIQGNAVIPADCCGTDRVNVQIIKQLTLKCKAPL